MFENEIKRIYDHSLNKIKDLGEYINFEQLISANLHPAILQYISAEIDYLIFEDRQKILKNSVFDYSSEKIRTHLLKIGKELKKNKRFSQKYITKLILHAVSFNVNFLARPKWALIKFIFDDKAEKSSDEVRQILNYIHYYAFIKKILILYIEKKGLLALTKNEFKELLNKIDESGIETNQAAIIDKTMESMADFFNVGLQGKALVSLAAVRLYFREKNLSAMLTKINNKFAKDDNESYDMEEIKKALEAKDASMDEESEKMIKELVQQESVFILSDYDDEEGDVDSDFVEHPDINDEDSISEEPEEQTEPEKDNSDSNIAADEQVKDEIILEDNAGEELIEEQLDDGIVQISPDESPIIEQEDGEESVEPNDNLEQDSDDGSLTVDEEIDFIIDEKTEEDVDLDLLDEKFLNKETSSETNTEDAEPNSADGLQLEESELAITEDDEPTAAEQIDAGGNEEDEIIEIVEDEPDNETNFEGDDSEKAEPNSEETEEKQITETTDEETLSDIMVEEFESDLKKIDMTDLLENKKMTKIIEIIFDYDMEDLTTTIELISNCPSFAEANGVIDKLYDTNRINPNSKEAQVFKELISEYFD